VGGRFKWKNWLEFAYKHKLVMANWPEGVGAPGSKDFEFNKIGPTPLWEMVGPFLKDRLGDDYDGVYDSGAENPPEVAIWKWDDSEIN
jgi:hypothetical protein